MEKYEDIEQSLRPITLDEYIGQDNVKNNMSIFINAARNRNETLDHVLLFGPPGLGKTTLAGIIAKEMGVNIKVISGPTIERSGDLAAILSTLEAGDVLFIDEIHRMNRVIEEILYPAMEDFVLDIIVGQDSQKRSIRIDLPPFTLVGATTRVGDLSAPLRDRFGIVSKLEYYNIEELTKIIKRTSNIFDLEILESANKELAMRSRGTPRIANRLFRRVRDFAEVLNDGLIDSKITDYSLEKLNIDNLGLNNIDKDYLNLIVNKFSGGPVGIDSISSSLGEDTSTIEDMIEPYLLKEGFIKRTIRGRVATDKAINHLRGEKQ